MDLYNFEAEVERDVINLVILEDFIEVWKIIYADFASFQHLVDELKYLTDQALKLYWGEAAYVDFDLSNGVVCYLHPDGRKIERFIAF